MTLPLALQASAVYALALCWSRSGRAVNRRSVLIFATVVVAALPFMAWMPSWSTTAPAAVAVFETFDALQEPVVAVEAAPDAGVSGPSWTGLLGWVWLAGALVAALRLVLDLWAVQRLRASATDVKNGVATSSEVDGPVVVGLVRPLVLMPPAATRWPEGLRDMALKHERAHIRGHDNAWLLLARVLAVVHWFNPLSWLTVAALREACELHADDVVVESGTSPVAYAEALIAVARTRVPATGFAMARAVGLRRRVEAVLSSRQPARQFGRILGGVLVAAVALGTATAAPPVVGGGTARAEVETLLEAEAERIVAEYRPQGLAIVVLDARTGVPVATAQRGGLLERPLSPGSVVKPFGVVAALEAGVGRDHAFEDGTMASILARSSNPGALQIAEHVGLDPIVDVYGRVGIPSPRGLTLKRVVLGDGLHVTPMQMAVAWQHLSGHGRIDATVAATTRELLAGVTREGGTGHRAAVPGVPVAGQNRKRLPCEQRRHGRQGALPRELCRLGTGRRPRLRGPRVRGGAPKRAAVGRGGGRTRVSSRG